MSNTKQIQFDDDGNALITQSGPNFKASMSLGPNGKVIAANSETLNPLATGSEIAGVRQFVNATGARIVNSTTADGHISEETWATVDGKQTLQSSKVLSYSQAERDVAAADVALAGLELIQALRSGNKVQAAGSLIRLVNQAQVASNTQPVLGAMGTGFSGAVSILSALSSCNSPPQDAPPLHGNGWRQRHLCMTSGSRN